MAKELDLLRRRYPQYEEVDDLTLATGLVKKYPQYKRVLEQVMTESQKDLRGATTPPRAPSVAPEKDLYSMWGAEVTPEMRQKRPYLSATAETLQETMGTPALHFLNVAALNYPRYLTEKGGYKYPEPKTKAGQILAKGAGLTGAFASPILKAIAGAKVPARIAPTTARGAALEAGIKGAIIGGGWAQPKEKRPVSAAVGFGAGAVIGGLTQGVKNALARKPEKVNQIRQKFKEWTRKESQEYGRMEKQLGKKGEAIDPIEGLEWMEQELYVRGMINEMGQKMPKAGASKVDRGLYNSYRRLSESYAKATGGKVPTGEVIRTARDIKAAGGKPRVKFRPTAEGKEARGLKDAFMQRIKPKIKGPQYEAMNKRYAEYKRDFEIVDRQFNIWDNELATGKGEKALTKIFRSGEMRTAARVIEEQTGIKMTKDMVLSWLGDPAIRQVARDAGYVSALWYMASRLQRSGEVGGSAGASEGGG